MLTLILFLASVIFLFIIVFFAVDQWLKSPSGYDLLHLEAQMDRMDQWSKEHALLLQEIKDAQLDYDMGKISKEDFDRLVKRNKRAWIKIDRWLRQQGIQSQEIYIAIEEDIQKHLQSFIQNLSSPPALERKICPHCASANPRDADICMSCGTALSSNALARRDHD